MKLPDYPIRPLVYQTDPAFSVIPRMKPSGCYFLSWVEAITAYLDMPFTHQSVIDFFKREVGDADEDVDNEMFVHDPQDLMDDLAGKGRLKFLGVRDVLYTCNYDEIEIGCWHKTGNGYSHFTHNNGKGIVLYDPWGPDGSDSVSEGHLIGKRVARLL